MLIYKAMKTAEEFLNDKFNGKGYEFKIHDWINGQVSNYSPCELLEEYAQQNTLNMDKVIERITKDPAFEGLPEYAKERLEPLISDALCSLSLPTLSEEEIDKMAWNYAQDQTDDRGNQIEIHDDYFEGFKACQELTKPKEER